MVAGIFWCPWFTSFLELFGFSNTAIYLLEIMGMDSTPSLFPPYTELSIQQQVLSSDN